MLNKQKIEFNRTEFKKGWTWARNLDYQGFLKRLENEYKYMDAKGIYYYDFRNKNNHPEPER